MKQKIFCVGNAHLDPAWMWKWQEGSAEAKATIRSALDRMKEFPEFKFVCSSASVYEWIEEFDPDMFSEIKQRVEEGRFIIVGGWYVQPDCNIPSGEGFARQSLYSQRYFQEKFGKTAKVGYNVDSFGHNGMLPQILKKSGMDNYIFMRPMQHEKAMDSNAFRWISPDGSEVYAYRLTGCYCYKFGNSVVLDKELEHVSSKAPKDLDCVPFFYGVGNHGGGPTIKHIQLLLERAKKHPETEIVFSDLDDFFAHLREQKEYVIPEHRDDLQHHASGCYAAYSPIKTLVRKGETSLLAAEVYSMMNYSLLGRKYPTEKFAEGWKNINFLHFHDIMGGCCIKDAYPDSEALGGESLGIAVKTTNNAVQTLSWAVDTSDRSKGTPVVVFNPHPFPIETILKIGKQITSVHDGEGKELTYQYVYSQTHLCYRRCDSLFRVKVPAFGYATYYLDRDHTPGFIDNYAAEVGRMRYAFEHLIAPKGDASVSANTIEDNFFKVEFDKKTGYIVSLFDRKNGRELLDKKGTEKKFRCRLRKQGALFASVCGAVPTVVDESAHDTWSHGKNYFDKVVGFFSDATLERLEKGPLRTVIRVTSRYGKSTLQQIFRLQNDGVLRVEVKLDWHEKQKLLKLAFPLNLTGTTSLYEMPFGVIERPTNGEEECGHMWIATIGKEGGVAMLNDSKYSFSVKDNVMNLTAIRSPYYADHGAPFISPECELTDQGVTEFNYGITLYDNNADAVRKARLFNTAPSFVIENNHNGTLKESYVGLNCDADNIIVSAIKRSEDGKGIVVRAYETNGKETTATIGGGMLPTPLTATFKPYSVDTYFLPDGGKEWKYVLMTEMEA